MDYDPMIKEKSFEAQWEYEDDLRKEIEVMLSILSFDMEIQKTIKGRSGIIHEIDFAAKKKGEDSTPLFLIRCKSIMEETRLRLDEVLFFWAQILDTGADRGIIVTTCKVSESAVKFANHHRITIISGKGPDDLRYKILRSEVISKMKLS